MSIRYPKLEIKHSGNSCDAQSLLDSLPDAVLVLNANGHILSANLTAVHRYGYALDDLKRMMFADLTVPELHNNISRQLEQALKFGIQFESELVLNDGAALPVEISARPIVFQGKDGLLACVRDIGLRKKSLTVSDEQDLTLERILDAEPGCIYIFDLNAQTNIYSNRFWLDTFGYRLEEIEAMGNSLAPRIFHPEDLELISLHHEAMREAKDDEIRLIEYRCLDKAGNWHWMICRETPFARDEKGKVKQVLGIAHDISERKLAELALTENEALYRSLFNNMLNGFAYCQMIFEQGQAQDYLYLNVNPAFETLTGLKNAEGKRATELIPGIRQSDPGLFDKLGRVALTGEPERFEIYLDSLQQWFWLSVYCPRKGYFVALFDVITQRKLAEKAQQESKEKLNAALASMTDAVFISDEAGQFIEFNDAFATFHRFKRKSECGRFLADYVALFDVFTENGEPVPVEMWAVPRALRGETATNVEYTLRRKDSGETWMGSYSFAPMLDNNGTVTGSVVVARDITERKSNDKALARAVRSFRILSVCNQAVAQASDEIQLFKQICQQVVASDGFQMAWIGKAETDQAKTVRPIAQAGDKTGYLKEIKVTWADNRHGQGPTGTAIREGRTTVVHNASGDPDYTPWRKAAHQRGYQSSIALPLMTDKGQCQYVLNVYSTEPDAFDESEVALLSELARNLTYGVGSLRERQSLIDTEASLEKERSFLKALIQTLPDLVWLKDVNGTYLACNPRFEQLYGVKEARLVGKTDYDFVDRELADFFRANDRTAIAASGPRGNEEVLTFAADGHQELVETIKTPMFDNQGKLFGVLGISRDITQRKQSEQALRESEEQLLAVTGATQDAIIMMDNDEKVMLWNPAAEKMFGYSADEIMGHKLHDLLTPERFFPAYRAGFALFKDSGRGAAINKTLELMARRRNGEEFPIDISLSAVQLKGKWCAVGIVRDISERKKAETALRESEATFRSLFENMLNGFAYCRMIYQEDQTPDFIYLNVNQAFETLTGLRDVIGKKVSDVIPGIRETTPELIETYGRVAMTGIPERFESYVEPLKMWFWISVYSPRKEYFVAIFDVITERKRAEEQLKITAKSLETAQRIAQVGSWQWDFRADAARWSSELYRIYGLEPSLPALPYANVDSCYTPESWKRLNAAVETCVKNGHPFECDVEVIRPNGEHRWTVSRGEAIRNNRGEIVELRGTVQDITERKLVEEEIKTANTFLDTLVEMSPFALWVSDAKGILTRTNHSLRQTLKLRNEQIIGKYNVLQDRNLEKQDVMHLARSVYEQHQAVRFSIPWKLAEANNIDFEENCELYIDVSMFPILDASGNLTNVVCQWADITSASYRRRSNKVRKVSSSLISTPKSNT